MLLVEETGASEKKSLEPQVTGNVLSCYESNTMIEKKN